MAPLPIDIRHMVHAPNIRPQVVQAVEQLAATLGSPEHRGVAYRTCTAWQRRYEHMLLADIPDWSGLAGFRAFSDFTVPDDKLDAVSPCEPVEPYPRPPQKLHTLDMLCCARHAYFVLGEDLHSGKFQIADPDLARYLLSYLPYCDETLGGQAGNILWLWQCIGARGTAFTPYPTKRLIDYARYREELHGLGLLRFNGDAALHQPMSEVASADFQAAPTDRSIIVVREGRRLILQFAGFRDWDEPTDAPAGSVEWRCAQFEYRSTRLHAHPLPRDEQHSSWPRVPLFSDCHVDTASRTLVVKLVDAAALQRDIQAIAGFAVIGGFDALFLDPWLTRDAALQARLISIAEEQLRALHSAGVRIGVELSGLPRREYYDFLRQLCLDGVIAAIGINGVDELPDLVGSHALAHQPNRIWLDPNQVPHAEVRREIEQPDKEGPHFEYVTFLRARQLATGLDVRTLYVHTNSLDFILRRDADPGALWHAQRADMLGKGLVIAALLRRRYGTDWVRFSPHMPPAIKPSAMARLGRFALDFECFEGLRGTAKPLLEAGYWLAPSTRDYSLAVAPVMWPSTMDGQVRTLNVTGSGDMTFGAFFFLGGV